MRGSDLSAFFDEETGYLPEAIPERMRSLAVCFGAIVGWVTDRLPEGDWLTNVPCGRSPGRQRCRGEIVAELDRPSGHIAWRCPICGDSGVIHGWEDTLWIVSTVRTQRRPMGRERRHTDSGGPDVRRIGAGKDQFMTTESAAVDRASVTSASSSPTASRAATSVATISRGAP